MWRHELDPLALMAGMLFTGLGIAFLAGGFELPMRWIGPLLLILVGIVGLVTTRPRAVTADAESDVVGPAAGDDVSR